MYNNSIFVVSCSKYTWIKKSTCENKSIFWWRRRESSSASRTNGLSTQRVAFGTGLHRFVLKTVHRTVLLTPKPSRVRLPYLITRKKRHRQKTMSLFLVEATGVEPVSKNQFPKLSPSTDASLNSQIGPLSIKLADSVAL